MHEGKPVWMIGKARSLGHALTLSLGTALAASALLPSSGSGHNGTGTGSLPPHSPPSGGGALPSSTSCWMKRALGPARLEANKGPPEAINGGTEREIAASARVSPPRGGTLHCIVAQLIPSNFDQTSQQGTHPSPPTHDFTVICRQCNLATDKMKISCPHSHPIHTPLAPP